MFEKIKNWYRLGLWTRTNVYNAVLKNIITEDQKEEILSQEVVGNV